MVGACWLLVANRATLAGAADVPFITLRLGGGRDVRRRTVIAVVMRTRNPARYAGLGHSPWLTPSSIASRCTGRNTPPTNSPTPEEHRA